MNTPNDIQGKHVVLTSRSPLTQLTEQAGLLKVIAVGDIKYMRRFLWEVEKLADFWLGEGTALYPVRVFLSDTLFGCPGSTNGHSNKSWRCVLPTFQWKSWIDWDYVGRRDNQTHITNFTGYAEQPRPMRRALLVAI